ncbi:MAG: Fic family protein [Coriobacteriia bacterium]
MRRGLSGRYEVSTIGGETFRAFVPEPLPPNPPLDLSALQRSLERASIAIGRLDSVSTLLPDTALFLYTYVRKEAVLSSQIEGTQSSLSDLLLFELEEAPGVPFDDVVEVSNYVAALDEGLARLRGGFPISARLIREIHAVLLSRGRGSEKQPGEFRRSQNWIGGTRPGNAVYVPPPHEEVQPCIAALERFLHDEGSSLPLLVKAALAHAQFETIHPFLDGNGRVGRLLVTLLLCEGGVLREPLLYLSLYMKQNRDEYYRLLSRCRTEGEWEAWVAFFLEGVAETADDAVGTARSLVGTFESDRRRIQDLGRKAGSALRVHDALKSRPVLLLPDVVTRSGLSFPAAASAMDSLEKLGIAREVTGKKRNRVFAYSEYLRLLSEGT